MKRRLLLIAGAALLVPGMALAHGPTRQKTTLTTEVAAEPAAVWEVIGNFQDMSWHPTASPMWRWRCCRSPTIPRI